MRLTIGRKIIGGFSFLIVIFVVNALIVFITLNENKKTVQEASEVRASLEATRDFKLLVTKSKMYTTNWVYLQSNTEDQDALKKLQDYDYPELRDEITSLKEHWADSLNKKAMDSALYEFETLIETEKKIMGDLNSFEDYEDPFIKLTAEDEIESIVLPTTKKLIGILDRLAASQTEDDEKAKQSLLSAFDTLSIITLTSGVFMAILGIIGAYVLSRSITRPISFLKGVVMKLSKGELVDEENRKFGNDEVGEMALAMDNLVKGLKSTTSFAENIGKGNYASDYQPLSEEDVLGNALIDMRDNLKNVADEDQRRNWATEGVAKFGEILRTHNNSISELSDQIIRSLVKYLEGNQGGLYILDDQQSDEEGFLTLSACYAWDKKKFLDQKIFKGEGLVGQCWQEMDTVYLTDVPNDYINITSGLGDANPSSVLIVPLKVNDEVFGVIEIASFANFEKYEIEFVEKIGESIASTISSAKINSKTHVLLEESQQMTEQMRAQEEEMRQNMEELQATQEEMQRSQRESQGTLSAINGSFVKVDLNEEGVILNVNEKLLSLTGFEKDRVIGSHYRILAAETDNYTEKYAPLWDKLNGGNSVEGDFDIKTRTGNVIHVKGSFSPMLSTSGEVEKIVMLAVDV